MRESGYLQIWYKALLQELLLASISTLQLIFNSATFRQKLSLYNCFSYFQVGASTAFSLINLQQLIPFTVALCNPNSESLCLTPEKGCLHTSSATSATVGLLPPSSLLKFLSAIRSVGGRSFLITWFLRHKITHKFKSKFSIS